jgi:hypothetical protein
MVNFKNHWQSWLQKIKKEEICTQIFQPVQGKKLYEIATAQHIQAKGTQEDNNSIGWIDSPYPFAEIGNECGGPFVTHENKKAADNEK